MNRLCKAEKSHLENYTALEGPHKVSLDFMEVITVRIEESFWNLTLIL